VRRVLLARLFGLAPQPFLAPDALALAGPLVLCGKLAYSLINAINGPLYGLMVLLLLRVALRRTVLVGCAYIAICTVVFTLFSEAHPVIGWFVVGARMSLLFWVYLRLGFLAGIIATFSGEVLQSVPLTTNLSTWYAGNGAVVVGLLLALASFGCYTSQAGRPIFKSEVLAGED